MKIHALLFIALFVLRLSTQISVTDRLWRNNEGTIKAILNHSFVQGMASGDLKKKNYDYYTDQDMMYLSYYSRASALAGVKTTNNSHFKSFLRIAQSTIVEREQVKNKTSMNPANIKYTEFLTSTARNMDPFYTAVAIAPCGVLYGYLGRELAKIASPTTKYMEWITLYNSTDFETEVKVIEDLINDNNTPVVTDVVNKLYETAMKYEYEFFDAAYRYE
ncbi:thiamine biosynthesis multifunctional protein [Acrasis kona]|uniref:Thiamine biosynthesis multifunctional protein n=1 Tax=Acrasis kona TaxID=1008807 RepID=A0AAW2YJW0_9EUKA